MKKFFEVFEFFCFFGVVRRPDFEKRKKNSLTDPKARPELGSLVDQPRQRVAPDRDHPFAALVEGRGDRRRRRARTAVASSAARLGAASAAAPDGRIRTVSAASAAEALPSAGLVPRGIFIKGSLERRRPQPRGGARRGRSPAPPFERRGRGGDEAEVHKVEGSLGGLGGPAGQAQAVDDVAEEDGEDRHRGACLKGREKMRGRAG